MGFVNEVKYKEIMQQVEQEVITAIECWPDFNSAHEGFAVLKEEVDELWDQVKINQSRRLLKDMQNEAIQVAAMAIRFAHDICNPITLKK